MATEHTAGATPSLKSRAQRVLAGGPGTFSKNGTNYPEGLVPQALVRGEGAYVWGDDGRKYLDTVAALGPILLGHANPVVNSAIRKQLLCGTSFSLMHPLEIEVAELFCDVLPCAEMVRWCRNGTDATQMAIRVARAITGKRHAIYCGYHGGGSDSYGITTDKSAGILDCLAPYNHQTRWNDLSRVPFHAYDDLAIVMVEVPSVPWGTPDADIAKTLEIYRHLADVHDALFVLDEIVTWPRYALGGAQTLYGVTPDLCTVNKAIANGLPLAALVGKRQYMERLNQGDVFASYTFAGETTALAAAKAVITTLRDTDAFENLRRQGQALGEGLQMLFGQYALPVTLLGNYARMAVRWQDVPGNASALELQTLWMAEMARRGILMGYGVIFPMTCWTTDETQKILQAAEDVCVCIADAIATNNIQDVLPCPVIHNSSIRRIEGT